MTDRYTHIRLDDNRTELETLSNLIQPSSENQRAIKTGIDDNFLPDSYFKSALVQTPENCRATNVGNVQKTQLSVDNEGAELTLNQQVEGSSPSSFIVYVLNGLF